MKISKYKNIVLLILGIFIAVYFLSAELFQNFIGGLGAFGYLGGFIAGVFFVSTFTVVPAGITLFLLGQNFNPYFLTIVASFGAVCGDLLIFRFVKDELYAELEALASEVFRKKYLKRISQLRAFSVILPVIGAVIIASPLPDELGIAMMGIVKMKTWKLALLTFCLNGLGILAIVLPASAINKIAG